ncbi:glutamine synthetase-like [Symsagittifera roscoffensis]|uniref:glutamine synthetase-like n=1 Tax=Symsagittifera roscoffensis TaxID=84072 RepID=UPI00307C3194
MDEVPELAKNVDFTRFTWCDTMGIPRCKVITREALSSMVGCGIGMCSLACVFDASTTPANYPKIADRGYPDVFAVPDWGSWHFAPWSGSDTGSSVAEVMVELHEKDEASTPCGFDVRHVCSTMVDRLKSEFGLELYSALEYEFVVLKDRQKMNEGPHIYSPVRMKKMEKLCFTATERLKKAGIIVEAMNPEFGPGQYEMTMQPAMGVKGADNALMFKQCIRETAMDHDLWVTFMSCPFPSLQNGGHFNFSLWDKDKNNKLHDDQDPDKLSHVGKHWIAGLLKHAPALTAFACQTNNCYNRFFEGGFAAFNICYGHEHRGCMLRVKKSKTTNTFLEFRSPGSAANPYLVMAAVVAAGMDGLRNKLEPPPIGFSPEKQLPRTLEAALDALESDEYMRETLGEDLTEPFLILKRQKDLPVKSQEDQFNFYSELI